MDGAVQFEKFENWMRVKVLFGISTFEVKGIQGMLKQKVVVEGDQTDLFTGIRESQDILYQWGVVCNPIRSRTPFLSDFVQQLAQIESDRGKFAEALRVTFAFLL